MAEATPVAAPIPTPSTSAMAGLDLGQIRYAQCWEDAEVLLAALTIRPGQVCLSIASGGDNTLALLTARPARVIAIDLSAAQLACLALRVAAFQTLDHGQLLALLGARPSGQRLALLERCLVGLDGATAAFWWRRRRAVARFGAAGVGKFEGYLRLFRRVLLPLVHRRTTVAALLQPRSAAQRRAFYRDRWNTRAWRWLLGGFFSPLVLGRLGRDPALFRHAPRGEWGAQLAAAVAFALVDQDPAANPYLHGILRGHPGPVLPLAWRREHFATIRRHLDRLEWRQQSLEAFVAGGEAIDAWNLSDVFEYLSPAAHAALYRGLVDRSRPGARLVYWNLLALRSAPEALAARVEPQTALARRLKRRDGGFFYRRLRVEVVT
ncbi:MAG: DUF3419 family protein [Candidatus Competibacterales bacterium]